MRKLNFFLTVSLLTGFSILSACEKEENPDEMPMNPNEMTIAKIAAGNENFSILVEALSKADLVNTLDGAGDFTVFAPDNEAFTALFETLGVNGIDEIPAEDLKPILLYHVIGAKATSDKLKDGYINTSYSAIEGNPVSMFVELRDGVKLNGSTSVTTADLEASNGVIHVVDAVLLPTSVVDIAINNSTFSKLVAAVVKAELVETLSGSGPFTVFAPTDDAFSQLFEDLQVGGIEEIPAEDLVPILQYHVVSGNVLSTDLSEGDVPTLNGNISVSLSESVTINGTSGVIAADIQGSNGVVHVINKVLLPQ